MHKFMLIPTDYIVNIKSEYIITGHPNSKVSSPLQLENITAKNNRKLQCLIRNYRGRKRDDSISFCFLGLAQWWKVVAIFH